MFLQSLPPTPPAIVTHDTQPAFFSARFAAVSIEESWRAAPLATLLADTAILDALSSTPYEVVPLFALHGRSDTELVAQAVARLKDGLQGIAAAEVQNIREGLAIVEQRSDDPYVVSVARLYQILPTERATPQLYRAPDSRALFEAAYGATAIAPVTGAEYPAQVQALFSELHQIMERFPALEQAKQLRALGEKAKFSDLTEKTLEREGQGMPPELVLQGRGELVKIIEAVGGRLDALRAEGSRLTPEQALSLIYTEIRSGYGALDREQPYLLDGLVTRTSDCDIYTKVFCEIGERYNMPIRPLYLVGLEHNTRVGHCMPCIELRQGEGTRLFVFETRSAIETMPDGTERRLYRSAQEIKDRINKIAGRELMGTTDKPFFGSERFILSQIPPRRVMLASHGSPTSTPQRDAAEKSAEVASGKQP